MKFQVGDLVTMYGYAKHASEFNYAGEIGVVRESRGFTTYNQVEFEESVAFAAGAHRKDCILFLADDELELAS